MKKTYNVYSTKMTLKSYKALSVSFIFALFFLGMSSNVNAQLATSRANAGTAVDADYSITLKAELTVSDEDAMTILETELNDVRAELQNVSIPTQEAKLGSKFTFLTKTISAINDRGSDLRTALHYGQSEMALQIARYNSSTQLVVGGDSIVRSIVERLK
jgi:uncharacterized protein involved in exopolysaccharide biosynthesis